jgi:hypothetical protein
MATQAKLAKDAAALDGLLKATQEALLALPISEAYLHRYPLISHRYSTNHGDPRH